MIQLVIQLVGIKSSQLRLLILRKTLLTQHTQLHQFTQHKQLLHSRISHNKHGHSTATSCLGSMFVCCCTFSFCPFCLLFCVLYSLSVFLPLCPFSTDSSHHFSHFFWLPHHSTFLPPTSPWLSICSLSSCIPPPSLLFIPLSQYLLHDISVSLPPPSLPLAFGRELQSQLFILELLQAHHDGILVYAGLSSAGHQSHTHQLLLHAPHQLCGSHGPCGGQGRRLFCRACQRGMGNIKGSVVHHLISSGWQKLVSKSWKRGEEEGEEDHNIWKIDHNCLESSLLSNRAWQE